MSERVSILLSRLEELNDMRAEAQSELNMWQQELDDTKSEMRRVKDELENLGVEVVE